MRLLKLDLRRSQDIPPITKPKIATITSPKAYVCLGPRRSMMKPTRVTALVWYIWNVYQYEKADSPPKNAPGRANALTSAPHPFEANSD